MANILGYRLCISLTLAIYAFSTSAAEKTVSKPQQYINPDHSKTYDPKTTTCPFNTEGTCSASGSSPLGVDDATPTGSNFTHVCDIARTSALGFDMTKFTFCDNTLPYHIRAKDLVDRMTVDEKVAQLGDHAAGVPRLGLPKYLWWSEALHGVANTGPGTFFDDLVPSATSFPTPIVSGASFNATLWKTLGQAISTEARAMYNLGRAGLTYWSPTMNLVRDPRWGRTLETPGEDPYHIGVYSVNFVRGLQDVEGTENFKDLNSRPLKVSACCKHYTAYDVDNWNGVLRFSYDARVTEQDMVETFLPSFEMCIKDGDVSSIMCSYNRVNGIPTCADPKLLNQTIRGEWGLRGYIVADCDSIREMVVSHHFLNDSDEDAVAQTLKAGLDLDCGEYYPKYTGNAIKQGKVRVSDVDRSLQYLYIVLMRLGYFDGSPKYAGLGKKDICTNSSIELAAEAARQGIVLLKNDGTLPLSTVNVKSLAVVGPHANSTKIMVGNYAYDDDKKGSPCRYTSPKDGFSAYANVSFASGCLDIPCPDGSKIAQAVEVVKGTDATILLVGLDLSIELEARDRVNLLLPGSQPDLIKQVAEASKGPVILVILCAGGVDISFVNNIPQIKAILWAGYPGEEGGRAIADVVFGEYNPGGRLPVTWYPADYVNQLPMTSMPLRPVGKFPGRTYKFYTGPTVYPFGYGLSYTKFNYKLTSARNSVFVKLNKYVQCHDVEYSSKTKPRCPGVVTSELKCMEQFQFEISLENIGDRDGSDVVMVYSKPPDGIVGTHAKQLVAFQRVFVPAGSSQKVNFVLNACKSLSIVDASAYRFLPSGAHTIIIGDGEGAVSFAVQVNLNY